MTGGDLAVVLGDEGIAIVCHVVLVVAIASAANFDV